MRERPFDERAMAPIAGELQLLKRAAARKPQGRHVVGSIPLLRSEIGPRSGAGFRLSGRNLVVDRLALPTARHW